MKILTDFIPPSFFRKFYIWEILCQVKHPCQQVFLKTFTLNSCFDFVLDLAFSLEVIFRQFVICGEKMFAGHLS